MPRKLDDLSPIAQTRAVARKAEAPLSDRDREMRRKLRAKFTRKVCYDADYWYSKMKSLVEQPGSREDLPKAQFLGKMLDRLMPVTKENEGKSAPKFDLTIIQSNGSSQSITAGNAETIEIETG